MSSWGTTLLFPVSCFLSSCWRGALAPFEHHRCCAITRCTLSAPRSRLPSAVDPKPLVGVFSYVRFYDRRIALCKIKNILLQIACLLNFNWFAYRNLELVPTGNPSRKEHDNWCAQLEGKGGGRSCRRGFLSEEVYKDTVLL